MCRTRTREFGEMFRLVPLRVIFVTLLIVCCSHSQPCTDPVSFNSTQFTIRGPCPNDTVLLVPVGDTVHYRCDYEDSSRLTNLPFWHITQLSDTPFILGEGNEHDITITSTTGVSGSTTLSIPVKEQYLKTTLDIQCGLCSLSVCVGGDRLSENITSTSIQLVTFSSPSNLSSVTNSDQLSLSWSPPPVSADYTNTSTLVFTYNLTLTNNADPVQTISFTTDSNQYNISEVDLPSDYNVCGRYSWSVGISHNGMTVNSVESNDFVHIPSGPSIVDSSVVSNLTECPDFFHLSLSYKVHSCSSASNLVSTIFLCMNECDTKLNGTVDSTVTRSGNDYDISTYFVVHDTSIDEIWNATIVLKHVNKFDSVMTHFEVDDVVTSTLSCNTSHSHYTTTTTSSSTRPINTQPVTITSSTVYPSDDISIIPTSSGGSPVSPSPGSAMDTNNTVVITVVVLVVCVVILCIVCVVVVVLVLCRKKSPVLMKTEEYFVVNRKKKTLSTNGTIGNYEQYHNALSACSTPIDINSPKLPDYSECVNGSNHYQTEQVDCPNYAIPLEVKETMNSIKRNPSRTANSRPTSYTASQILSSVNPVITGQQGYTEPASSVPRVDDVIYTTVDAVPPRTTPIHNGVVEVPGYSEVHIDPRRKRMSYRKDRLGSTPRSSCSSLPVTPAHDKYPTPQTPVFLQLRGIDETDGGGDPNNCVYDEINKENIVQRIKESAAPIPTYVDVNVIKNRKRNRVKHNSGHSDEDRESSVLSNSGNVQDSVNEGPLPDYVDVEEIKRRKKKANLLYFEENMMIEMKELPPPTPKHDLDTSPRATPPPTSPPPIPPRLPTSPTTPPSSSITS